MFSLNYQPKRAHHATSVTGRPVLPSSVTPVLQLSVTPVLQLSVTPVLQLSVTPVLQLSVTPVPERGALFQVGVPRTLFFRGDSSGSTGMAVNQDDCGSGSSKQHARHNPDGRIHLVTHLQACTAQM